MVAPNKRSETRNISYTSKLRSVTPTAKDNDTARIKACVDTCAPTSEIVEEAYRLCRINGYLRKDLRRAKDDLRLSDEFKKRQAVREDALEEMREELLKTQKLLERTWGYLEYRNIKVPADMKATYQMLKTRDLHDWQQQKGMKKDHAQSLQGKQTTNANRKQKQKAKKKASEHQTNFLLHTDEGTTLNLRDPVINDYTDDDTDSEAELSPTEINDAIADETSKHPSGSNRQIVDDGVTCSNPEPVNPNPFAKLKKPKSDAGSGNDAPGSGNATIFIPIVEGEFGANVNVGVKRKNTLTNDYISGAMKKARFDPDVENVQTVAAGPLDKTTNFEKTVASEESSHQSIEETKRTTSKLSEVTPTTSEINKDLEEGEIDEHVSVRNG